MQSSALAPLRIRPFRRLLAVDGLNLIGDWAGEVALALLVFAKTKDPIAVALLFLCLQAIPALASPALVARLEALPANRALPLIYVGEAGVFVGLGFLASDFFFPAILALALVDGALSTTSKVLVRSTSAALLTPTGQLRQGNALLNVVFTSGFALGPALAGIAVAALGLQTTIFIDAATFAVAAAVLAVTAGLTAGAPEAKEWLAHLREGLRYIRGHLEIRRVLVANAFFVLFIAAITPIEVVFVKETLGAGDAGYGAFLAAWGAGTALGGVIFLARRKETLYALAFFACMAAGVAAIGIALSYTLLVACGFAALGGLGNGVGWVAITTAIQEATADKFQARVVAVHKSLSDALVPGVAFVLGGVAASATSVRTTFAAAGVGVLVTVLIAVPRLLPFAGTKRA